MTANVIVTPSELRASAPVLSLRGRRRRGFNYFRASGYSRNRESSSSPLSSNFPENLQSRHPFLRASSASAVPQPSSGQELLDSCESTNIDDSSHTVTGSMARHRATTAPHEHRVSTLTSNTNPIAVTSPPVGHAALPMDQLPTIRFASHTDARSTRPSLSFPPTSRTLPEEDCIIRVGRYSERDGDGNPPPNIPSAAPVGFKSKVVSRRHCEFWCSNGQWYIRDVKSSSGTFLNHIRLSSPNEESRPFPVKDGDVVQLGIDFRGGEEPIFRCVKIRVECNRAWQKSLNSFNVSTHKRLRDMGKAPKDVDAGSTHSSECAICLMAIAPCQALFVAPCSHVWHYRCIRTILNDPRNHNSFLCPNCRAVADLDAEVDEPLDSGWDDSEPPQLEEIDVQQISNTFQDVPTTNGADTRHDEPGRAHDSEDDMIRAMASTNLALRNEDSPIEASTASMLRQRSANPQSQQPQALSFLSPDRTMYSPANDAPSILNRRNAQRYSPSLTPDQQPASFGNYLRPITPTAPLTVDDDLAAASSGAHASNGENGILARLLTPTTTENFVADGPMTPTNSAGPFVFDGSAGRSASAEGAEEDIN